MVLENGINHLQKIFETFFSFGQFWGTLMKLLSDGDVMLDPVLASDLSFDKRRNFCLGSL